MSLQKAKASSAKRKQLTNNLISALKVGNVSPIDRKKIRDNQKFFDGSGLYLQISKTGHKIFRYKYYSRDEKYDDGRPKPKVVTLGEFAVDGDGEISFSLEQAQAKYRQAMAAFKRDKIDPQKTILDEKKEIEKELERKGKTFKLLALEWLNKQIDFTSEHKKKILARFEGDCFPLIGNKPIDEVTRQDIDGIKKVIVDRGAIDTARRVISWLEKIFDEALFNEVIPSDPTSGIKKRLPKVIRGKFKAVTDPVKLREILLIIDEIPAHPTVKTALKLLPHIFVRQMELRYARWKEMDFERGLWTLHKAKVKGRSIADEKIEQHEKDFIVPLSKQVIDLLKDLKPFAGESEFCFPGLDSLTRPISNMALGVALKRAGITETTPHGFRSTFKTLCGEIFDIDKNITEHMLSHCAETDKYGYHRGSFLAQRRALAQVWSDYIDQLKKGAPDIAGLKKLYLELTEQYKNT